MFNISFHRGIDQLVHELGKEATQRKKEKENQMLKKLKKESARRNQANRVVHKILENYLTD